VRAVRLAADQNLLLDGPGGSYRSTVGSKTWSRLKPAATTRLEAVDGLGGGLQRQSGDVCIV
jgi:hypothetical protein